MTDEERVQTLLLLTESVLRGKFSPPPKPKMFWKLESDTVRRAVPTTPGGDILRVVSSRTFLLWTGTTALNSGGDVVGLFALVTQWRANRMARWSTVLHTRLKRVVVLPKRVVILPLDAAHVSMALFAFIAVWEALLEARPIEDPALLGCGDFQHPLELKRRPKTDEGYESAWCTKARLGQLML